MKDKFTDLILGDDLDFITTTQRYFPVKGEGLELVSEVLENSIHKDIDVWKEVMALGLIKYI